MVRIEERVFRRLLEASQAGKDDPYGEYLFSKRRRDLKGTPEGSEEDTEEEKELFKSFVDHYNDSDYTLGDKAPLILDLIKNGKYAKLLAPPPPPYYRIIVDLDKSSIANMLKMEEDDLIEGRPVLMRQGGEMVPGGTGSGSTGIHSWTTDLLNTNLVDDFQMQQGVTVLIMKVKKAHSPNNFFVNHKEMSNVVGLPRVVTTESEVISYGPVNFDSCVYMILSEESFFGVSSEMFTKMFLMITRS